MDTPLPIPRTQDATRLPLRHLAKTMVAVAVEVLRREGHVVLFDPEATSEGARFRRGRSPYEKTTRPPESGGT